MTKVAVGFEFNSPGFIAKPYWPERNDLINIGKDVHPKLGEAKKQAALNAALEKRGLNMTQYEGLVERAARPFYTDNQMRSGEIVIPARIFQSFLNHASQEAPKAIPRIQQKGLTFIAVKISDGGKKNDQFLRTGQHEKDAVHFQRFVKLEESNQRSFTDDLAIENFTASGVFEIDEEIIKESDLRKLIEWGGRYVGIGSARPQGYGRFIVKVWTVL